MRGGELTNELRRSRGPTVCCVADGHIDVGAERVVEAFSAEDSRAVLRSEDTAAVVRLELDLEAEVLPERHALFPVVRLYDDQAIPSVLILPPSSRSLVPRQPRTLSLTRLPSYPLDDAPALRRGPGAQRAHLLLAPSSRPSVGRATLKIVTSKLITMGLAQTVTSAATFCYEFVPMSRGRTRRRGAGGATTVSICSLVERPELESKRCRLSSAIRESF